MLNHFDEGRVILYKGTVYFTETHIKDHLGNTRVAFGVENNALVVKQVNSYYPFGMNIKGLTTGNDIPLTKAYPPNEYLYNGKMFQDELGLDWLDYGARFYDAALGRWHVIDNKAEKYYFTSPYTYAINNPIIVIDPDGNDIIVLNNSKGASGFGHMAVLIGNDNDGWTYISKDGRADSDGDGNQDGTMLTGGRSTQTIKSFASLDEAMSSDLVGGYDEGFQIGTTAEQDAAATGVAEESSKTDYQVITSNCADVAYEAIESTGANGGYDVKATEFGTIHKDYPITPNNRYDKIVENNENGKKIDMPIKQEEKKKEEVDATTGAR